MFEGVRQKSEPSDTNDASLKLKKQETEEEAATMVERMNRPANREWKKLWKKLSE